MSIRKVAKNSVVYTVFLFLQKGMGLLLLPIYTVYLSQSEYGIISVVNSLSSFLLPIVSLMVYAAGTYFTYNPIPGVSRERLWGTIIVFSAIVCLAFVCILLLLLPFWGHVVAGESVPLICIGIGVVAIFFHTLFNNEQSYWRSIQKAERVGVNNIVLFIITLGSSLLAVLVFKWKAEGVLLAGMVGYLASIIIGAGGLAGKVQYSLDLSVIKRCLMYSIPIIPHGLFNWALTISDRLIMNKYLGIDDVGLYSVAYQFAGIVFLIITSVNQAYGPWFLERTADGRKSDTAVDRFVILLVSLYAFVAFSVSLFSEEIVGIFTGVNFHSSWIYIPPLAFSLVFHGCYFFFVAGILKTKTVMVTMVTSISCVVSIGLNLIIIPRLGIMGGAITNLVTYFLTASLAFLVNRKLKGYFFRPLKVMAVIFIFAALASISFMSPLFGSIFLIVKISLWAMVAAISVIYFWTKNRMLIREYLRKLRNKKSESHGGSGESA